MGGLSVLLQQGGAPGHRFRTASSHGESGVPGEPSAADAQGDAVLNRKPEGSSRPERGRASLDSRLTAIEREFIQSVGDSPATGAPQDDKAEKERRAAGKNRWSSGVGWEMCAPGKRADKSNAVDKFTIVIKNINFKLPMSKMSETLDELGVPPMSINYAYDADGDFRGTAFLKYSNTEDSDRALEVCQNYTILGRQWHVEKYVRKVSGTGMPPLPPTVAEGSEEGIADMEGGAVGGASENVESVNRKIVDKLERFKANKVLRSMNMSHPPEDHDVLTAVARRLGLLVEVKPDGTIHVSKPAPPASSGAGAGAPSRDANEADDEAASSGGGDDDSDGLDDAVAAARLAAMAALGGGVDHHGGVPAASAAGASGTCNRRRSGGSKKDMLATGVPRSASGSVHGSPLAEGHSPAASDRSKHSELTRQLKGSGGASGGTTPGGGIPSGTSGSRSRRSSADHSRTHSDHGISRFGGHGDESSSGAKWGHISTADDPGRWVGSARGDDGEGGGSSGGEWQHVGSAGRASRDASHPPTASFFREQEGSSGAAGAGHHGKHAGGGSAYTHFGSPGTHHSDGSHHAHHTGGGPGNSGGAASGSAAAPSTSGGKSHPWDIPSGGHTGSHSGGGHSGSHSGSHHSSSRMRVGSLDKSEGAHHEASPKVSGGGGSGGAGEGSPSSSYTKWRKEFLVSHAAEVPQYVPPRQPLGPDGTKGFGAVRKVRGLEGTPTGSGTGSPQTISVLG
eukprot:jgi/Mesvir1/29330/Mv01582-RA.1